MGWEDARGVTTRRENSSTCLKGGQYSALQTIADQAGGDASNNPSQQSKHGNPDAVLPDRLDATVQCGLYGAEVLSASPFLASSIGLAIIGNIIHIWWYDRQGAIQTTDLDFTKNLPHFVVLLLALQRLGPVGYRELPFAKDKKIILPAGGAEFSLGGAIVKHYGIVGRATSVYAATSLSPDPRPTSDREAHLSVDGLSSSTDSIKNLKLDENNRRTRSSNSLKGLDMVVKISWVQENRIPEHKIVQNAIDAADKLPDHSNDRIAIIGHVPEIIAAVDYTNYDTKHIRVQLGFSDRSTTLEKNRRCRIILARRLFAITELEGDNLLEAFWECVLCHRALWTLGFHHRDISERNLMYFRNAGKIFGVLNDFDLATMDKAIVATGSERKGTLPFMALDLLSSNGLNGQIEHLYRHDLESFWWVLVWIIFRYRGGKLIQNPPFSEWAYGVTICVSTKTYFLRKGREFVKEYLNQHSIWMSDGLPLQLKFKKADSDRDDCLDYGEPVVEAETPKECYDSLMPRYRIDKVSKPSTSRRPPLAG
ncbi:hypothetical protein FRB95_008813 [Tulasnella sp. JGI-2019a]|nr:hypothetical protein FRB95_008813 [Tulasnella sp. JGI-2019a]